ncbi:MAG TPA: hypothetical protein PJ988_04805, partial [Anaerolinea sp.]|nr:hypothetical protein [Anaerolinea sp.]
MKTRRFFGFVLLVALFSAACGQATPAPVPTVTPAPSPTPSVVPTNTPVPTDTPVPNLPPQ